MAFWLLRLFLPEQGVWGIGVAAEVAFLALATALAYVFWDIAMQEGDVVLVASCSYLTPFFSTGVSCMYLRVVAKPQPAGGVCAHHRGLLLELALNSSRSIRGNAQLSRATQALGPGSGRPDQHGPHGRTWEQSMCPRDLWL